MNYKSACNREILKADSIHLAWLLPGFEINYPALWKAGAAEAIRERQFLQEE